MFGVEILNLEGLTADPIERVAALLAARNQLEAEMVSILGALDSEKVTMAVLGLSTNEWLSGTGHVSLRSAKRLTAVGRAHLERFDDGVLQRVRDGRVGVDHLDVLVRYSNPRIEPIWSQNAAAMLDLYDHMTFGQWERAIAALAKRVDADGAHDPADDTAANRLRLTRSGSWVRLEGEFHGEAAEAIEHALGAMNALLWEKFWQDHKLAGLPMPSGAGLSAMALQELVRNGNLVNSDGTLRVGAVEASFVIQFEDGTAVVRSRDGRVVDEGEFGRLLCDPTVRATIVDSLGRPLDVGQRFRLATDDMRAAISARDGGCVFPGCCADSTGGLEAHHIRHFLKGGATAVDNLSELCRRHHGVVHRAGWAMFMTDDGWTIFRRPDGVDMWGQQYGVQRTGPMPELPERSDLRCGRYTCTDDRDGNGGGGGFDLSDGIARLQSRRVRRAATGQTRVVYGGYGADGARGDGVRNAATRPRGAQGAQTRGGSGSRNAARAAAASRTASRKASAGGAAGGGGASWEQLRLAVTVTQPPEQRAARPIRQ